MHSKYSNKKLFLKKAALQSVLMLYPIHMCCAHSCLFREAPKLPFPLHDLKDWNATTPHWPWVTGAQQVPVNVCELQTPYQGGWGWDFYNRWENWRCFSCRVQDHIRENLVLNCWANPNVRALLRGSIPSASSQQWGRAYSHSPLTSHAISL